MESRQPQKILSLTSLIDGPLNQFQQLGKYRDQIRILCLHRGLWSDPISCTTFNTFLEDSPPFIALSYAWGDPLVTHLIRVNDQRMPITTNLFAALRSIRHQDEDINLWADQICINQRDEAEKAHQIILMRRIYETTTEGIMWLGDCSEGGTEILLDMTPDATTVTSNFIPRTYAVKAFDFLECLAKDIHLNSKEVASFLPNGLGEPNNVLPMKMLLDLPWWRRIWTVQEVVLPPKATFQCGNLQISLETLDKAMGNFLKHYKSCCSSFNHDIIDYIDELATKINVICTLKESILDWRLFVFALHVFRKRLASNERDKIYGLIGLFPDCSSLTIDYSLTCAEICAKTSIELIRLSGDLRSLLGTREATRSSNLPSWVPDWCTGFAELESIEGREIALLSYYEESNATRGSTAVLGTASYTSLPLLGIFLDTITCDQDGGCEYIVHGMPRLVTKCLHGCLPIQYPLGGTYSESLIQPSEELEYRWDEFTHFLTKKGFIGASDCELEVGDEVYLLLGGKMPFILRAIAGTNPSDRLFTYVGHAYVYGAMDGSLFNENDTKQWVNLV